jgi:hypothetical protein
MENIFWIVNAVTIGALLLSIIYTAGVVWRVEMKLDVSYKFFLAGIIFLLLAEALSLYYPGAEMLKIALVVKVFRLIFALCFLLGVIFMRNLIRCMDGEKK